MRPKNVSFYRPKALILITIMSIVLLIQVLDNGGSTTMWKSELGSDDEEAPPQISKSFLEERRSVYRKTRENVLATCIKYNVSSSPPDLSRMIYSKSHRFAYCSVPKAASSMWTMYFLRAAGRRVESFVTGNAIGTRLLPMTEADLTENVTSLAVVRHPLSRLVSAYYSKIVDKGFKQWDTVRQFILQRFRKDKSNSEIYPSPEEFLDFILFDLKSSRPDNHWRPQHSLCPFCAFNFTVISRYREMAKGSKYFLLVSGLGKKTRPPPSLLYERVNPTRSGGNPKERERKFWRGVKQSVIARIEEAYAIDLEMFGFSIGDYFKDLGIKAK